MPQVGTNEKPMMISAKPNGKILGDTGSFYKAENKKKYDENYDAIFGKKKNTQAK
jgi:hypothetical protein